MTNDKIQHNARQQAVLVNPEGCDIKQVMMAFETLNDNEFEHVALELCDVGQELLAEYEDGYTPTKERNER